MRTVIMHGCKITDTQFTLDRSIFGVDISWNITRLLADAAAGVFGDPEVVLLSQLPPMTPEHEANIDWGSVNELLFAHMVAFEAGKPSPLDIPTLSVIFRVGTKTYRTPVDGNHRISARIMLGMFDFRCFVVPLELEGRYRITVEEVDG